MYKYRYNLKIKKLKQFIYEQCYMNNVLKFKKCIMKTENVKSSK